MLCSKRNFYGIKTKKYDEQIVIDCQDALIALTCKNLDDLLSM